MLGVVAALFGLLLAFVIIIAYENFLETSADVSREADSLASLVRDSAAFAQPEGDRVRDAVGIYARAVVEEEWELMRDGSNSPRATRALDGVFAALQNVEPRSPDATGFFDDSVRQLNDALDARRDRLEAARGGLPFEMAALILFSSLVIVGYSVLVGSPNFWFHVLGPAAIAIVVVFSLLVLLDLSYPSRATSLSIPSRSGAECWLGTSSPAHKRANAGERVLAERPARGRGPADEAGVERHHARLGARRWRGWRGE
jgi:hypothetical protein